MIAVLGLGAMGSRIARRLLDGSPVSIWNRSPGKTVELARAGARVAATPREAALDADFVFTMLTGPDALDIVASGPDGFADALKDGATVIEMSTVGPAALRRLRDALPADVALLDAPVLGSLAEAAAGELTLFVGGEPAAVAQARPLLDRLGQVIHLGGPGSGAAAKLVANCALLGSLAVLGEALALADALALDRTTAFDVLATTPLASQDTNRRPLLDGDDPPRFTLALARKDAELMLAEAGRAGRELLITDAVARYFTAAEGDGYGDRDYTALLASVTRS
jgi:3-hydroxyisobutyrate dehydrogenase-like beta-hydroxyacid dehydrogenase